MSPQILLDLCQRHPIVPVYYNADIVSAKAIVKACYDGGLRVFEFTNRGEAAARVFAELIPFVREQCPDMADQLMDRFPAIRQVITTRRTTLSASHNQLRGLLYDQTGKTTETPTYDIVPIVDRIGGGDAFMAGFIYGSHAYATAEEALRCGVAASVLKHSIHGDANLATLSEIEAVMAGDTAGRLLR